MAKFFYWLLCQALLIDPPDNTVLKSIYLDIHPPLSFFTFGILAFFLIVAFASVVVLYSFERISLNAVWKILVVGLMAFFRTGIIFMLFVLLFFRPVIKAEFQGERTRPFVVLLDHTQSIKQADKRLAPADKMRVAMAYNVVPADQPMPPEVPQNSAVPVNPERLAVFEAVLKNDRIKLLESLKKGGPLRVLTFGDNEHFLFDETAADMKRDKKKGADDKEFNPDSLIERYNQVNESPNTGKGEEKDAVKADAGNPLARFGHKTALWDQVYNILQKRDSDLPAGIFIMTDGVDNASRMSLQEVATLCSEKQVPLYIYGVGSAEGGSLRIKRILSPDVIVMDDKVSVTVSGRATGLKPDTRAEVTLTLDGKQVAREEIVLQPGQDWSKELPFEMKKDTVRNPEKRGVDRKLSATVKLIGNDVVEPHTKDKTVQVVDRKVKVLYIENSPRWEYQYIQLSYLLRDRRVEPKFLLIQADPQAIKPPEGLKNLDQWPYLAQIPKREDLFKFDLIILGDVPLTWPGQEKTTWLQDIRDYVSDQGGALIHIAGQQHAPACFAKTPLAEVLPVEFEAVQFKKNEETRSQPYVPILTEEGERSEMLALADTPEKSLEVWKKLPALPDRPDENKAILKKLAAEKPPPGFYWHYPVKGLRAGATSLMAHPKDKMGKVGDKTDEKPMTIMATQYYGKGPVLFLATDETWRWRSNGNDREVARLWGQIIYEMGMPHVLDGGKRVQIALQGGTEAVEGSQGNLYVTVFDKQYRPYVKMNEKGKIEGLPVTIEYMEGPQPEVIFPPDGKGDANPTKPPTMEPVPGQEGHYRLPLAHSRIGRYRVTITEPEPATFEYTVNRAEGDEREPSSMAEADLRSAVERSKSEDEKGVYYQVDSTAINKLKKDGVPDSVTGKLHNLGSEVKSRWWFIWPILYTLLGIVTVASLVLWLTMRQSLFSIGVLLGAVLLGGTFLVHQMYNASSEMAAMARAMQEDQFSDEQSFLAALEKRLGKPTLDEHKTKLLEHGKQGTFAGKFYREEDLYKLTDDMQPRKATFVRPQEVPGFVPLVMVVLVLAFGVEWLIRKMVNLT